MSGTARMYRRAGRRARWSLLALLCGVTGVLWLGASVGSATKVATGAFGSAGSEAGQFGSGAPGALAVNQSGAGGVSAGDVYVVDPGNNRIDEFSATGSFVRAFGLNVGGAGVDVCTTTCVAGTASGAAGALAAPKGIAIEQATGTVYVSDSTDRRVDAFSAAGAFEGAFGWDVDAGNPQAELQVCTAATTCEAGTAGASAGEIGTAGGYVAVSPAGDVYLGDQTNRRVDEFAPTVSGGALNGVSFVKAFGWEVDSSSPSAELQACTTATGCKAGASGAGMGELGTSAIAGIAIDGAGAIYVVNEPSTCAKTNPCRVQKFNSAATTATELTPSQLTYTAGKSATGAVNQIAVDESDDHVLVARQNADATEDVLEFNDHGALIVVDGAGESLSASGGLAVGGDAGSVYFAEPAGGQVRILGKPSSPTVGRLFTTDVSATSADLQAQISANGVDTHYYFEYGTESCAGAPSACVDAPASPGVDIGAGEGYVGVEVHLLGLLPDTRYHYRLVASNGREPAEVEATFTTQSAGAEMALLDGREWELVSPASKRGSDILPIAESGVIQAAEDGAAIAYPVSAPTELEAEGYSNAVQVLSVRGAGGWSSQDIATPHDATTGVTVGKGYEYRFFSSDLSLALVEPQGPFTPLSSEATERTVYVRDDLTCSGSPGTCYRPLVTAANTPAGTELNGSPRSEFGEVQFVGASPDLSHVVLSSSVPLTSTAAANGGLYEWVDGELELLSVLPEDEGGIAVQPPVSLGYVDVSKDARNAVSVDGTRVFWSSRAVKPTRLYMRDTASRETLRIGTGAADFQTASSDGRRVFFSVGEEGALEACEITEVAGKLACDTAQLAPQTLGVVGTSEDAAYVYYVSDAQQAPGAVAGTCKFVGSPVGASCNLYERHYDGVEWEPAKLVAVLSGEDAPDWGTNGAGLESMTARVSPDGNWLAFMSERSLTGYDNTDAASGQPDEEVYIYDNATGRLACVSCDPTGALPQGEEYSELRKGPAGGGRMWSPSQWLAANIPGWTPYQVSSALYQSRYLSDSGRLFFNSSDALVPQDVNGTEDVYEYEPPTVGSCTTDATTYGETSGGCVDLVSSGISGEESAFMDASANGDDIFFLTQSQLSAQDTDASYDIYDAHVCTGASPCTLSPTPPPPCDTADACRTAPGPQPGAFGSPASATFSGAGNATGEANTPRTKRKRLTRAQRLAHALKRCHRQRKKRRAACRRRARGRHGRTTHSRQRGHGGSAGNRRLAKKASKREKIAEEGKR